MVTQLPAYTRLLKLPARSFFLFGMRGVGKSTWVRQALPEAARIDLLDEGLYQSYLRDPGLFGRELARVPAKHWVIVDEVQRLPNLLNDVHRFIEERHLRFALLGSSARKLKHAGVNLLAGRDFTPADTGGSVPVTIVNEAFARHFFGGVNPVGMSIATGGMSGEPEQHEIVGVCSDCRRDARREAGPTVYFCQRQNLRRDASFAVRSVLPALSLVPAVRRAVAEIDPDLPLQEITTQKLLLERDLSRERTLRLLFVGLGVLALGAARLLRLPPKKTGALFCCGSFFCGNWYALARKRPGGELRAFVRDECIPLEARIDREDAIPEPVAVTKPPHPTSSTASISFQ